MSETLYAVLKTYILVCVIATVASLVVLLMWDLYRDWRDKQ